jgi:hypothetical protein
VQLLPKRSTPPDQEAKYVQKWCKLITAGWEGFTRELLVERSKANPKPLVFAMLTNGEYCIQMAHGFGILALESDHHPSNGLIGCFVGDRVITDFQGETIIQEPQFVTLMHTDTIEGITTKPAADGTIKKVGMNGGLLKGSPKASPTVVPAFFPLPLAWVPYFLEKTRTNTEAYCHMSKKLASWQKGTTELRECSTSILEWFRSACTLDPASPDYSVVDLSTRPLPKDNETTQWSMAHLQSTVPRPTPRDTTLTARVQPTSLPVQPVPPRQPDQTAVLCERIMALSDSILSAQVERERPSETAKKLSEVETCRLLGYCGLAWSERHLLPAIWTDLKKQADRASREAVLAAFFAKLAEKEPSLRYFNNQALFEDIINHRFLPGDTYETCHKGLSPLAFLPKSFADTHDEKMADEYYNEATVKTVMDVRKHRTKGPPPIPMNDAELLRLNTRDVIVLEALFTEWSALVRQEVELNRGLHDQQMDLFSSPDSTRDMIPNLLWAKIKARRMFFLTTCTREMLDRPNDAHPIVARATLNTHSLLFLSGTKVSIVGVPYQWQKPEEQQGPTKRAKHSDSSKDASAKGGKPGSDGRYGNDDPWASTDNGSKQKGGPAGTNSAAPRIFATSAELNEMRQKFPNATLTHVAIAAGYKGPMALNTTGLQDGTCLLWVCFGKCTSKYCRRMHPATVPEEAAAHLYQQLLPGINKLRTLSALPAIPGRK